MLKNLFGTAPKTYRFRGGRVQGIEHIQRRRNDQDGKAEKRVVIGDKIYYIASVSDGCSESEHSEVAASLLPPFVVNQVAHLLEFETPVSQIPTALYPSVIGFLEGIAKQYSFSSSQEAVAFIKDHLLATVLGFVVGQEDGVVFCAGDGLVQLNDEITRIDYNDASPYIAYHLVPRSTLKPDASELPRTFTTFSLHVKSLKRVAITTDGFSETLLQRMWKEAKNVPTGIQLWMQWINGPRNINSHSRFFDDAAVETLELEDDHA